MQSSRFFRLMRRFGLLMQSAGEARTFIFGRSESGDPLLGWQIGNGRPCVHINASVHANEWITSLALTGWVEQWLQQNKGRLPIAIQLVPLVNPDGVRYVLEQPEHHYWKANVRGVDLNDQFPAGWLEERKRRCADPLDAGDRPGPRDYGGPYPLSEREARSLARLVRLTAPDAVVSLHTQGREIYYNYRGKEPVFSQRWAEMIGNSVKQHPYRAVALQDSDAGFKDWFISETGKPGFTIEMGSGENPLPIEQLSVLRDDLGRMMDTLVRLMRIY